MTVMGRCYDEFFIIQVNYVGLNDYSEYNRISVKDAPNPEYWPDTTICIVEDVEI